MLEVFDVTLVSNALSALVALVISDVILEVFEVILVLNALSAFVALVISDVILDVLDVTLVSNALSALVALVISDVILDVFDVILVLNVFSAFVALVISDVILDVLAAIDVGKVPIVVELIPPTLFTVGRSAVPPKSFASLTTPFAVVVASCVAALVILAATNAVVAICVELVPAAAVGAVGNPVNAGEAKVLLVNVSVPDNVAIVPLVGKVILVAPVLVKVVL